MITQVNPLFFLSDIKTINRECEDGIEQSSLMIIVWYHKCDDKRWSRGTDFSTPSSHEKSIICLLTFKWRMFIYEWKAQEVSNTHICDIVWWLYFNIIMTYFVFWRTLSFPQVRTLYVTYNLLIWVETPISWTNEKYLKWIKQHKLWSDVQEYIFLSYNVASGSEKMPCNKICKPLVVYRFLGNVMTSITTLRI